MKECGSGLGRDYKRHSTFAIFSFAQLTATETIQDLPLNSSGRAEELPEDREIGRKDTG